jgi:hypothetical protein
MLSQDELKTLLDYCPETGHFRWNICKNKAMSVGDLAGNINRDGYRHIMINGRTFKAHRLVWLYVYGQFPENEIDHINLNKSDNRLINLREATRSQNNINKANQRNNTSGHKGVCWHKASNKWRARISMNNKRIHLGSFTNIEDAVDAYNNSAIKLHQNFQQL